MESGLARACFFASGGRALVEIGVLTLQRTSSERGLFKGETCGVWAGQRNLACQGLSVLRVSRTELQQSVALLLLLLLSGRDLLKDGGGRGLADLAGAEGLKLARGE